MKIALIALSGVRAQSEELNRVGVTLPGFVERRRVIASLPSLALLTLAGMTPAHVDLEYCEVPDLAQTDRLPACDLAAISTYTAQVKDAYELARRYRALGVKTVIGGLHATVRPQEALRYCDAVIVGEGELTWPQLIADFEAGKLQRVYSPEGRTFNLAEAPVPRFDLLQPDRYNRLTVQTQRGCPWRCEFCASSVLLTPHYKLKPIPKVVNDIRAIKRIWSAPFIEFADDNTFVNKRHGKELMRAIGEEHVRWFTETDISVADDDELLTMMHAAGCAEILIGLESPLPRSLEHVELKRNWKRTQVDQYESAIARIQGHGIAVNGCFVLGLDGDPPSAAEAIWDFVRRSGLFDAQVTVQTPFPGTPLYDRLQREGRLLDDSAWEKCTLFDVNFRPSRMSIAQLERQLIELGQRLYTDEMKKARVHAFRQQHWRFVQSRREVIDSHAAQVNGT